LSSPPQDPKSSDSKGISQARGAQTLIVVDNDDNFVEYATRSACHLDRRLRHRAVVLFVYNDQEEILLQKRKNELFDGLWDLAGATHPLHSEAGDESYQESVVRCLQDEWGISSPMTRVLSFTYYAVDGDQCENEHCVLFAGKYSDALDPSPEHVYESRWVPWSQLRGELEEEPGQFTPWLKVAADLLAANVFRDEDQLEQSFAQWARLKESLGPG
jgi:isopentenyl-diphosphate delta-isomerase